MFEGHRVTSASPVTWETGETNRVSTERTDMDKAVSLELWKRFQNC